jgi:tRNA threonylcarbamoyladenosine biosynthesis protein TsaE
MTTLERRAASESAMEALGAAWARAFAHLGLVTLRGPLGAGKTTLVRGLLRGLGHEGAVKSPTFTLVEPYALAGVTVNHFDLYRLKDPEELEFLGPRDYLRKGALCVVEWPERAGAFLPMPDVEVIIQIQDGERLLQLISRSPRGEAALSGLP